jgi:hypothetical protein
MMDSCQFTFSRKGSIAKIGFAPWHVAAAFGDRLSLKQYLAANHIVVATYAGVQRIPDKQLAAGRCQTEFVYSSALLRGGPTMPSWHRTRAHPN